MEGEGNVIDILSKQQFGDIDGNGSLKCFSSSPVLSIHMIITLKGNEYCCVAIVLMSRSECGALVWDGSQSTVAGLPAHVIGILGPHMFSVLSLR